jgi:hypothetical protein
MSSKNDFAKGLGFKNVKEMETLIASLNLIDEQTWGAFIKWATEDKSKAGLQKLIEGSKYQLRK